jgi:hypothetical protein
MTPQKLVVVFTSLTGGAIGLFAPIGVVKWLLQTEPEDAGILTLFFLPVWCLLLVLGLLIGRRLGLLVTGGKRVLQDSGSRFGVFGQERFELHSRNAGERPALSRYIQRRRDSFWIKSQESKPRQWCRAQPSQKSSNPPCKPHHPFRACPPWNRASGS